MATREKISCIVLTKDSGEDIGPCLEAVRWADEIIVVDDFSEDKTPEISRRYTDKVFERHFDGYPSQRDFGIRQATHQWVLCLDADERVTPELRDEILERLSASPAVSGFLLRRLNIVLNQEVKYSGWYETNNLRLFKKDQVSVNLSLKYVEEVSIAGPLGELTHDLLHHTCRSLDEYFKRVNMWSTLDACDMMTRGVRITLVSAPYYLFFKPAAIFLVKYLFKQGFRDRFVGFLIASVSTFTYFISYAKLVKLGGASLVHGGDIRSIEGRIRELNRASSGQALMAFNRGKRLRPTTFCRDFIFIPCAAYGKTLFFHRGPASFFDRILFSSLSFFTSFITCAKIWEMQRSAARLTAADTTAPAPFGADRTAPRVGIAIVTYNNAVQLGALLCDLSIQTRQPDEIIVIDNASSDNTASVVKASKVPVRYVRYETNLGSAGGFREGVRLASESNDLIWLLDDDVFVEPEALRLVVAEMERLRASKRIGAVRSWGRAIAPSAEPLQARAFAWRGTLIRKDVIEEIGLPRDDYFLYGEDTEYSMRMVRKGYSIFWIPASHVIERTTEGRMTISFLGLSTTVYKDTFRLYYATRNQFNVYLAYGDIGGLFRSFVYIARVMILLNFIDLKRARERSLAIVRGVRDGLMGRLGVNAVYTPLIDRHAR